MGTVVRVEERRDFSRIAFHCPAELTARGATVRCELLDISLLGALIQVPAAARWSVGDACAIAVRLDQGSAVIRMTGEIVHVDGGALGVRCDEIDLDSIGHLRRLVELNLGDEHLLQRELSALLARRAAI